MILSHVTLSYIGSLIRAIIFKTYLREVKYQIQMFARGELSCAELERMFIFVKQHVSLSRSFLWILLYTSLHVPLWTLVTWQQPYSKAHRKGIWSYITV